MPRVSFSGNTGQKWPARSSLTDTNGVGHGIGAVDSWCSLWRKCAPNPVSLSEENIWSCFAFEQQSSACTEWLGFFIFVFFCNVILTMNLLILKGGAEAYLNWVFIKNLWQLGCPCWAAVPHGTLFPQLSLSVPRCTHVPHGVGLYYSHDRNRNSSFYCVCIHTHTETHTPSSLFDVRGKNPLHSAQCKGEKKNPYIQLNMVNARPGWRSMEKEIVKKCRFLKHVIWLVLLTYWRWKSSFMLLPCGV